MKNQPNILHILTDQQFAGAMSCAGNEDLHTPAIDALASRGVRFEKAYCTQAICGPSRASMMTGMMPQQIKISGNSDPLDSSLAARMLGSHLKAHGYHCAYAGKWHIHMDQETAGFQVISPKGDEKVTAACVDFLGRRHDKPFFLFASLNTPHDICQWARTQELPEGPITESPLEDCPTLPANFAIPPYEPQLLREVQKRMPSVHPTLDFPDDHWRRYRDAYYRLCEKVDGYLARILEALRQNGLEENTLVIFSSDHGDGLGAHKWNQKWALYEESSRVPLILAGPGVPQGQVDNEHLVSHGIDLFPTLCGFAGVEPPTGLPGRDLKPLLQNPGHTWRDALVAEACWSVLPNSHARMLRSRHYKYVVHTWGRYREQLFDMDRDPGEMVNLAVCRQSRDILLSHRELLRSILAETGDPFAVPSASV